MTLATRKAIVKWFVEGYSFDSIFWVKLPRSLQPNYLVELEGVIRDHIRKLEKKPKRKAKR